MNEFQAMLKTAKKQRDQLIAERNELSRKIAALDKTIEGLSAICEMPPEESPAVAQAAAQAMLRYAGFTDVVKMALQASQKALSASDVVSLLEKVGYPLDRFDNPRANVNTVFSRLLIAGQVEKQSGAEVMYKWIGSEFTTSLAFDFWDAIKGLSEPSESVKLANKINEIKRKK